MLISENDRNLIAILLAFFLLSRLPFMLIMPLVLDEGLYSVMIDEQISHPSLIPTYLGHFVSWKPTPFFWLYGSMIAPLRGFPIPFEFLYRLPTLIFGLLSIPPLYLALRKIEIERTIVFYTCLIFILCGISIYPQTKLLADAPLFFLTISAFYLYIEDRFGRYRFLAAGFLCFMAFFIKLVLAFFPPVLALGYFYFHDKKSMANPLFIISILFPVLAMGIYYLLLQSVGLGNELFEGNLWSHLISPEGSIGQIRGSLAAVESLFQYGTVWLGLSIIGFLKFWGKNRFMALWLLLSIIPLLSSNTLPWYFLPVLPAISYFAALLLLDWEGAIKADRFFQIVFAMIALSSLTLYIYVEYQIFVYYYPEKVVGNLLAGKNALIIGAYRPSIVAYKMHGESAPLDFGWVILGPKANDTIYADFVSNYHTDKYAVVDSLSSGFSMPILYRKPSNLTAFDYVVVAGPSRYAPPNSTAIYSDSYANITVFRVS